MNELVSAAPWVAYIAAFAAAAPHLAKLARLWGGFRKDRADATKTMIDGSAAVVRILREECDELEKDLSAARKQVKTLTSSLTAAQAEIADLRGQVDRMSKDLAEAEAELAQVRSERGLP